MMSHGVTGRIVVVDDEPDNLALMRELLKHAGHQVQCCSSGTEAIDAIGAAPPDLVLLDISMPQMDGFEVCRQLKSVRGSAHIPVIFLTALTDSRQKVQAFRCGAVDYVTKPFQADEVFARVETQLALARARQAERELLEQTLNGSLRMLADLVHLAGPALAERADTIRTIVLHLVGRLPVSDPWEVKLAATLCLLGCITLPPDSFERAYLGEPASTDEADMFAGHPEAGARLLATIPRLARVAEMIRRQHGDVQPAPTPGDAVDVGARMLRLALDVDRGMLGGLTFHGALSQLRTGSGSHPAAMVSALANFPSARVDVEVRRVKVRDLRPAMVVEAPVLTEGGNLVILPKHTRLSPTLIERVRNFAKTRGVQEPIPVRLPLAETSRALA